MNRPLVSVVIPAYNHEKFVGAAVESVLQQSCTDLELIVVNDGSTDKTGDVVQSYDDNRIRYYFQENQDAYNTINRGIALATGRFIAILNSDDVYTKDRLEQLLDLSREHQAVCLFSDVIPIDDDGDEFTNPDFGWNVWHRKNRDFYFQCGDLYTAFLKGNFMVTTSNLFMTAEAAGKVGSFCSLRYLHDYDFMFRMISLFSDKVHYVSELKLLYYRIHSGNTLGEAAITGREQDRELIRKYMLAILPDPYQPYVEAGSDRLVELERELQEVRRQLRPAEPQGVKASALNLAQALKIWVGKKLS